MRLTKALFYLSDAFAWLIASIAALAAVTYPIFGPIFAEIDRETITPIQIIATTSLFAAVAFGAWLLTRRKVTGLAVAALPALCGSVDFAVIYLGFVSIIFGTPLLLVFVESRLPFVSGSKT